KVDVRIVEGRERAMHGIEHALILLRSCDRQYAGGGHLDLFGFRAHAARDNDLAILRHRLPDRAKRFPLGAVEKAAGVDDDEIGAVMLARQLISFGAQARDDALGIHKSLGASERCERYSWRSFHVIAWNLRLNCSGNDLTNCSDSETQ